MSTVLVTGATGALGRQVLEFLLDRVPASDIAALARHPDQLSDMAARGVSVRAGDYHDPAFLKAAFVGVQKLLLVSAPSFSDAATGHHDVITAAADAGVGHLHFTAIQRRTGSGFVIPQVTEWNQRAEAQLASSGMAVTILRNTLYRDSLNELVGEPGDRPGDRAAGDPDLRPPRRFPVNPSTPSPERSQHLRSPVQATLPSRRTMTTDVELTYESSFPIPMNVPGHIPNGETHMFAPLATTLIYCNTDAVLAETTLCRLDELGL